MGRKQWRSGQERSGTARNRCDRNLYWNGGNPITVETESQSGMTVVDWRKWQESGADQNSLVADPQLSSSETSDFRPKANSPVWKLGFRPIPFEEIGPRYEPNRPSDN